MRSSGASRSPSIFFFVSLLLLFLLSFACASGPRLHHKHEFNLSPGQEHHTGLKRAALLPIDASNERPVAGIDVEDDRIAALVQAHLESKGIAVERIDARRFEQARGAAYDSVREKRKSGALGSVSAFVGFDDLVPEIVAALELDADVVIEANLVGRPARYEGKRMLVWDGVRRRENVRYGTMEGNDMPAVSLYVAVHGREGGRLFSGYGGIEPLFQVERAARKYVLREDLFEDEDNLREAICIAFYPWFGMAEYCAR